MEGRTRAYTRSDLFRGGVAWIEVKHLSLFPGPCISGILLRLGTVGGGAEIRGQGTVGGAEGSGDIYISFED